MARKRKILINRLASADFIERSNKFQPPRRIYRGDSSRRKFSSHSKIKNNKFLRSCVDRRIFYNSLLEKFNCRLIITLTKTRRDLPLNNSGTKIKLFSKKITELEQKARSDLKQFNPSSSSSSSFLNKKAR